MKKYLWMLLTGIGIVFPLWGLCLVISLWEGDFKIVQSSPKDILPASILNLVIGAVLLSALLSVCLGFLKAGKNLNKLDSQKGYILLAIGTIILAVGLYFAVTGLTGKIPELVPSFSISIEGIIIPLSLLFLNSIALGIIILVLASFGKYFIDASVELS